MSSPAKAPRRPSYLRNLLLFVPLCLAFGMVGPIFLLIGLSTDEPDSGWLTVVGALVTAIAAGIGAGIAYFRTRRQQRSYRLRVHGRPGRAEVLEAVQTNVEINGQPLVRLRLRISGEFETFEVESREVIPHLHQAELDTGAVPVLADPETGEWDFVWSRPGPVVATAVLPGTVASGSFAPPGTPAERLAQLDDLMGKDLITREEYDRTRARILEEL